MSEKTTTEEHEVHSSSLISKLEEILKEGNVQRVIIKKKDDTVLLNMPLTIGIVGLALAPFWAAIGAIAVMATECKIEVERRE